MRLMNKKKKVRKNVSKVVQKPLDQQSHKNTNLILGGLLLAMSSIGFLFYVLSEKMFTLI